MKSKILKRTLPILVSAITLSALYSGGAFAGSNKIPWNEVKLGDNISIDPGYYENETDVEIPTVEQVIGRGEIDIDDLIDNDAVEGISETTVGYYADGKNENNSLANPSDTKTVCLDPDNPTSINLGVNEQITLPSGYYFNNTTIKNGVTYRGGTDCVLTSTDNQIHFEPGYYDAFTVSTDAENIKVKGELTYTHHVHSLTTTTESVDNDQLATTSVPAVYGDTYMTSTPQGCFTQPHYVITYRRENFGENTGSWAGDQNGEACYTYQCSYCGRKYRSCGGNDGCMHNIEVSRVCDGYTAGCGHVNGQVTDVHIHYDEQGDS